jgi:hypothetical protein
MSALWSTWAAKERNGIVEVVELHARLGDWLSQTSDQQ